VVALGDITFLGAVPAIIITSFLLVSLPVALALLPLPLCVTTSIVLASPIYHDGTVTFAVVTPSLEALASAQSGCQCNAFKYITLS
jgi:hypothetical protein